ncbi:MAG: hypothetical protein Kapaf2KO_08870 [Candidatus Kapaibacteriales bacterium]
MMKTLVLIFTALMIVSCEDVIEVDLDDRPAQLVVDAWLNDLDEPQSLTLLYSRPYFDNGDPASANDAVVTITSSDGTVYELFSEGNGKYTVPDTLPKFTIGNSYTLNIKVNGEEYTSTSEMRPVPVIDSLTFTRTPIPFLGEDINIAEFWAQDLPGIGDTYWIRSYKNDTLLDNINLAYDGSTAPGSRSDDITFIAPIRFSINPDGDLIEFFEFGDTSRVQLFSISEDAFQFWTILEQQISNGGLFATPPVNTPTNIIQVSENGNGALGWFQISSGSEFEEVLTPENLKEDE